jgi:hypothetical protein
MTSIDARRTGEETARDAWQRWTARANRLGRAGEPSSHDPVTAGARGGLRRPASAGTGILRYGWRALTVTGVFTRK